jgi:hypothetical protein
MKSQLDQFDRDARLVLYAAGELSPDDRRRVEADIANDPATRAELNELMGVQQMVFGAIEDADVRARLPVDPRVAERRTARMIRQWAADRPERPPTVVQKVVGLKYPWWTYPATAAAAVTLAFLIWWGNTPMRTAPYAGGTPLATQTDYGSDASDDAQLVEDLERSFSHPSHEGIRAAEGDLYALSQSAWLADEQDEHQQEVSQ